MHPIFFTMNQHDIHGFETTERITTVGEIYNAYCAY